MLANHKNCKQVYPPTLDINVVMQAHQIDARRYVQATTMILGVVPDNNVVQ